MELTKKRDDLQELRNYYEKRIIADLYTVQFGGQTEWSEQSVSEFLKTNVGIDATDGINNDEINEIYEFLKKEYTEHGTDDELKKLASEAEEFKSLIESMESLKQTNVAYDIIDQKIHKAQNEKMFGKYRPSTVAKLDVGDTVKGGKYTATVVDIQEMNIGGTTGKMVIIDGDDKNVGTFSKKSGWVMHTQASDRMSLGQTVINEASQGISYTADEYGNIVYNTDMDSYVGKGGVGESKKESTQEARKLLKNKNMAAAEFTGAVAIAEAEDGSWWGRYDVIDPHGAKNEKGTVIHYNYRQLDPEYVATLQLDEYTAESTRDYAGLKAGRQNALTGTKTGVTTEGNVRKDIKFTNIYDVRLSDQQLAQAYMMGKQEQANARRHGQEYTEEEIEKMLFVSHGMAGSDAGKLEGGVVNVAQFREAVKAGMKGQEFDIESIRKTTK